MAGGGGEAANAGDAFAKSAKQRRLAAKAARAEAKRNADAAAKLGLIAEDGVATGAGGSGMGGMGGMAMRGVTVPLEEQSVDLPREGMEAVRAREELRGKMRVKGRRRIKEQNFLRGMS